MTSLLARRDTHCVLSGEQLTNKGAIYEATVDANVSGIYHVTVNHGKMRMWYDEVGEHVTFAILPDNYTDRDIFVACLKHGVYI